MYVIFFLPATCSNFPGGPGGTIYFAKDHFLRNWDNLCPNNQCPDGTYVVSVCYERDNLVGSAVRKCEGLNLWYPPVGQCVRDPTC